MVSHASHVGYDSQRQRFGVYQRLFAADSPYGHSCGRLCAVMAWYREEYDYARANISVGLIADRPGVFTDNHLLEPDRREGPFLHLDRLIEVPTTPLLVLSSAKAFAAAEPLVKAMPAELWRAERRPIGDRLTPDLFFYRRDPVSGWSIAGTGDVNGDADADIIWRNTVTGDVGVWEMNGTSITLATNILNNVASNWVSNGVGDFNGDGKSDILWRNTSTGDVGLWELNGPSIKLATNILNGVASNWVINGVGDVNGDGRSDIIWRNNSTGDVGLWEMNGSSIVLATNILNGVPLDWTIKGMGDFNGDGKSDILWYNTTSGDVGIWELNGSTILLPATIGHAAPNQVPVGTGDFNGDSNSDILLQATDGTPQIWTMNGPTVAATTTLSNPGQNWHVITG